MRSYYFFFIVVLLIIQPTYAQDYEISKKDIVKLVKIGDFAEEHIKIHNNRNEQITISFSTKGNIKKIIELDKTTTNINGKSSGNLTYTIYGEEIGFYNGTLILSGAINEKIPVNITISDIKGSPVNAIVLNVDLITKKVMLGKKLEYKIDVQNMIAENFDVTLTHSIDKIEKKQNYKFNKSFFSETEKYDINTTISSVKTFDMPAFIRPGEYVLNVKATYFDLEATYSKRFKVVEAVYDYLIFGILPLRWLLLIACGSIIVVIAYVVYRKKEAKKKKYKSELDFSQLPQPGKRSVKIGKIAETDKNTYFDLDQLTMHTLIAGSTGGGKTVSAEVLVEEALMKDAACIVFDPTAQWTGFLRKCTEKKMLDFYPKFGMKKSDAKAFNGNVKQILNAREIIDIKKYIKPGEITCFAINRLDPEDIDILVANTIREVFHANLPESKELQLLVIFDEVHRLLPKFGGSGEGFIQVERAAREFRKWGVGLFLISQVLTDFVGETKANINTEIQMRTRDQGDLNRIKTKYGGYMLQSLLKASTGTGMIENANYNRGNPYFVSFRPLLHEHARLSDEELENYNKYNEIIDDLEYQIDQLEKEGVDVFDMRLELKMALDKVKSGSFNMVNIYLEGLTPRIKEQWEKLGKKAKKREVKLVSEDALKKELEKAKKDREKYEKELEKHPEKKKDQGVKPLRLVTGIVIMAPHELLDALNSIADADFKKHVNNEKNDFADWIESLDKDIGKKVRAAKTKAEIIKILETNPIEVKEEETKEEGEEGQE